ncbi:MAG TPA: hypothetical protein ENO03_08960, partial [Candidatus Aminicenantes bacterium]|nr:hypothetical protein [Candidatus Aminicenantes bacterium]
MTKPLAKILIALTLVSGPACGRKSPLELPPGRAPLAPEGLSASAVDGSVVLEWLNPARTVSGKPLGPLKAVEVWVFDDVPPAGG